MEKLKLGLDLDNYPEVITLKITDQILTEYEEKKMKILSGTANAIITKRHFRKLLEVMSDIRLIDLKTNKDIRDTVILVDDKTLEVTWAICRQIDEPFWP